MKREIWLADVMDERSAETKEKGTGEYSDSWKEGRMVFLRVVLRVACSASKWVELMVCKQVGQTGLRVVAETVPKEAESTDKM